MLKLSFEEQLKLYEYFNGAMILKIIFSLENSIANSNGILYIRVYNTISNKWEIIKLKFNKDIIFSWIEDGNIVNYYINYAVELIYNNNLKIIDFDPLHKECGSKLSRCYFGGREILIEPCDLPSFT